MLTGFTGNIVSLITPNSAGATHMGALQASKQVFNRTNSMQKDAAFSSPRDKGTNTQRHLQILCYQKIWKQK